MSDRDRDQELTNAEVRLITDISMLIEARDPDGRIARALDGFLGFETGAEVREVLATGEVLEAEVYLGEAKLYVEVQRDDEGQDWIVRSDIEHVARSLDDEDRTALTKRLRKDLGNDKLKVLAGVRSGRGWNVVFEVDGDTWAVALSKSGPEPLLVDDKNIRPLAAQLVTERALEVARAIGPQAELEVFALRRNRAPQALIAIDDAAASAVAFDPKREAQWLAEELFAETGFAVVVDRMTGSVRVETVDPTF